MPTGAELSVPAPLPSAWQLPPSRTGAWERALTRMDTTCLVMSESLAAESTASTTLLDLRLTCGFASCLRLQCCNDAMPSNPRVRSLRIYQLRPLVDDRCALLVRSPTHNLDHADDLRDRVASRPRRSTPKFGRYACFVPDSSKRIVADSGGIHERCTVGIYPAGCVFGGIGFPPSWRRHKKLLDRVRQSLRFKLWRFDQTGQCERRFSCCWRHSMKQ